MSDDKNLPIGALDCVNPINAPQGDHGLTRGRCSKSSPCEVVATETEDLAKLNPPVIVRNARSEPNKSSPHLSSAHGLGEEALNGLSTGFRRACAWLVPPNWAIMDWHEELRAVALNAACRAEDDYEPLLGVPMELFVIGRVKARALTRLRQEWRYALRNLPLPADINETLAQADPALDSAAAAFESVTQALGMLSESEQWLLDQLFWQDRTEANIAGELGISQPAVNKRKRTAIFHLRSFL